MPYETYNPYGNRRVVPYMNEGQSLLNFSTFQPTFIGQPIQEMGAAYKAYRDTADMILDTGDALGQTLSQMNVDPKDRPMLAQKKLELDSMLKDVATTGDFAPARVKMRNVLNTVKQDQFYPAAENRYAMKLKAIEEVNKKAGNLDIGPQLRDIYLKDIESSFSPTDPDVNGIYTKEFIPRQLSNEFDFHKFLREFASDNRLSWKSLGYNPIEREIKINPDDPNSPTVKRLVAWQHGITGEIKADDLETMASAALRSNDIAKGSIIDLTRYANEIEGRGITEDTMIKQIVRPYAENFAYSDIRPAYDAAKDYDLNNPNLYQTQQQFGISGGVSVPSPISGGLGSFATTNFPYGGASGSSGYGSISGGIGQTSAPAQFKYNIPSIIGDPKMHSIANTILSQSPFQTDLEKLSKFDPSKDGDWRYVNTALDYLDTEMKRIATIGSQIVNDMYPITDPYLTATKNQEMFGLNYKIDSNGNVSFDEPTLEFKDGYQVNSLDLKNATIIKDSTKEKLSYEDFIKEIKEDNFGSSSATTTANIPLRLRGVYNPDNTLAYVNDDASLLKAGVYNIGGENYIIGTNTIPFNDNDLMQRDIGKTRYLPGYYTDFSSDAGQIWFPDTKIKANNYATNTDGRPLFNYELKTKSSTIDTYYNQLKDNLGNLGKQTVGERLNEIANQRGQYINVTQKDAFLLNEYLNTGQLQVTDPKDIANMYTYLQYLLNATDIKK